MVALADGLALRRLAERCAELGADTQMSDTARAQIHQLIADADVVALVAEKLDGDDIRAAQWLASVEAAAERHRDDDATLVTALAALGDIIIQSSTAQPTETFAALTLA